MELQFVSKPIHCLGRVVWDVQEFEQTQEVRLPEDMPDIGSVVCAWGQCVLRGKEWHADKVGVSGGVMAWVLYIPADGSQPRTVEAWLSMQGKWPMPECRNEGSIRTHWLLSGVDGRMLSARKILVRASAQVLTEAYAPKEAEVYTPVQTPADVQVLTNSYPVLMPKEAGEKSFLVQEDVQLPEMEAVVSLQLTPQVREQAVVGGKAVFRGDAGLHLVYKGQDGMIHSLDREVPFSQFSDLDRDYDKEAALCVVPAVSNLETEQTQDGLQIKASLVMQYLVMDREMVEVAEDAYSPLRSVICHQQETALPMELDRRQERMELQVEFAARPGQMADVSVFPRHCGVHKAGQIHELENCGSVQMLWYDAGGELHADTEKYAAILEMPGQAMVVGRVLGLESPQISAMGDRVEVHMALNLEAVTDAEAPMAVLSGLELGEVCKPDPARPSLILRRAEQESLWELAKGCGSTMDAIRSANGLEGEPQMGQMLLIPVS